MTLIIGLVHDGQAYLACDSIATNGHTWQLLAQPKMFKNGVLYAGFTDSFRLGQLLEHELSIPDRVVGQDLVPWLVKELVPAVRDTLRRGGYARSVNGAEEGGNFLLVAEHRIFEMQGEYSVLERTDGYAAVGSGQDYALASLHTTAQLDLPPLRRLELAFGAATGNVTTVKAPVWVFTPGADKPVLLADALTAAPA